VHRLETAARPVFDFERGQRARPLLVLSTALPGVDPGKTKGSLPAIDKPQLFSLG